MKSIEVTYEATGEKKRIDIYEVYWGDIIEKNYSDDVTIFKKFFFGLELIFFWIFSPIWKAAYKNKWMFIGIVFSGLLVTFWFISVIGILISALDSAEVLDTIKYVFHDPPLEEEIRMGLSFKEAPKLVSDFFTKLFVVVGVVLSLFPGVIALILKVSGFSMKFIKSQIIRDGVKKRLAAMANAIGRDNSYSSITFFAHSLGVIPLIHFISDYENYGNKNIRCITVGSPVSFLMNKTPLFKEYIVNSLKNIHVTAWYDFFSKEDWLCSYDSVKKYGDRFDSEEISMDTSWTSRLSTKPHKAYFNHSKVIKKLIAD